MIQPSGGDDMQPLNATVSGLLLWHMWYKVLPFAEEPLSEVQLLVAMSDGLRPVISEEAPDAVEAKGDVEAAALSSAPEAPPMPHALAALVRRMWHNDPTQRPDVDEVVRELERLSPCPPTNRLSRASQGALDAWLDTSKR
jgi:hypothetical protein